MYGKVLKNVKQESGADGEFGKQYRGEKAFLASMSVFVFEVGWEVILLKKKPNSRYFVLFHHRNVDSYKSKQQICNRLKTSYIVNNLKL